MKKQTLLALGAAVLLSTGLTGCKDKGSFNPVAKEDVKVGLICLHDDNSTYDKNFIDSMKRAFTNLGLSDNQLELATGIPEGAGCKNKAIEFAQSGCNVVFADSFGHEDYMIEAAMEYPNVRFAHATGTKAHTVNLDNYSNAFASIYEGRYLAGVAAGMKLQELKESNKLKGSHPKIGYVGAFDYAEVISGYTAFYLGAKSIMDDVTMEVRYTSSWFDISAEKNAATALIENNCDLISQHADSYGAPEACEDAGVPNVTYNGSTAVKCPSTYVVSSKIDWAPYFEYMINCVINGEKIATDYTGTLETGSVKLDAVGTCAAENTQTKIDEVAATIKNGTLKIFDTQKFTVNGNHITSYKADVDSDSNFTPDTEVVYDGYFHESEKRSAPYFNIIIDGITEIK